MNSKNLEPLLLVMLILLSFSAISQEKKDTIYFDEDWSICEKPVAEYYRVCELNKNDSGIFYKGLAKDYSINGQLKMTGGYSINGIKNGEFDFYNDKGFLIKKGEFLNDVMMGDWYFYDSVGKLRAQLFCKSPFEFTPILIINNNNDTVLKNGNGNFILNTKTDQWYIRPRFKATILEGSVHNGVKDGDFNYYFSEPSENNLFYTQKYRDGRFIKGRWAGFAFYSDQAVDMFSLNDDNLSKVDLFNHTNIVFGSGTAGLQKLINYLQYDISPQIQPAGASSFQNDGICFFIIDKVVADDFIKDSADDDLNSLFANFNLTHIFYSKQIAVSQLNTIRKISGDIIIDIDTTGKVTNSTFNINLPAKDINKINYYLQHVSNLATKDNNGQKINRDLNLKMNTVIDTLKKNTAVVRYVLYDADSLKQNDIANNSAPQIEAKFPGGFDAWKKFLEKNLSNQVPTEKGAPSGNYTVTVSFVVDEYGNISDVKAENNPGYGTAKEAVRVMKKATFWIPAIKDGKAVKYRQIQNITFKVSRQ